MEKDGLKSIICLTVLVCIVIKSFGQHKHFVKATWISLGYKEDSVMRPCPVFRRIFSTQKKIQSATVYITAHGIYEARLNQKKVGDAYFTPGWTSYDKRLQYQSYDVTNLLNKAKNTIELAISDGWYKEEFGGDLKENRYGNQTALLLQLDIVYIDGTKETIVSDSSWQWSPGEIRYANFYNGEIDDTNTTPGNWTNVKRQTSADIYLSDMISSETKACGNIYYPHLFLRQLPDTIFLRFLRIV